MDWVGVYLHDAHQRFRDNISGDLDWTLNDTCRSLGWPLNSVHLFCLDNAQALCSYETVALGFSHWCGLFTYDEWEGFEYALDIGFQAGTGFGSPVGRAVGIGKPLSLLRYVIPHSDMSQAMYKKSSLVCSTTLLPIRRHKLMSRSTITPAHSR